MGSLGGSSSLPGTTFALGFAISNTAGFSASRDSFLVSSDAITKYIPTPQSQ